MTDNVELIKRLHHIWSTGDLSVVEEIYAANFVGHWPPGSEVPERTGLDGVRFGINRIKTAFPDWHEHVNEIFGNENRWVSRYVSTGTHNGMFMGLAPTGRKIEIAEISIFHIHENKISEQWCLCDELGRLKQLGMKLV